MFLMRSTFEIQVYIHSPQPPMFASFYFYESAISFHWVFWPSYYFDK
ncbi:hypothetical protein SK3146_04389 [Paenibacillus konkukensis]|uniref:Uncharacterized protein n=1 Tax=Paenibacillus konkukensis TaxID=2020716 RepID=A0ABY4RU06_9BACL|nr:hypothetical protein SK3146_04389 [Paenibacillus konkukensis]